MLADERDKEQLILIERYAQKALLYQARYGDSLDAFRSNEEYRDLVSFCFIQIGEAVNRLSETFLENHADIDWRSVYGLRCYLVHGYENISAEILWETLTEDLPELVRHNTGAFGRKCVFHPGRNLIVLMSVYHSIRHQLFNSC